MPFEQTAAERAKLKNDDTPWSEPAVAVRKGRTSDGLASAVIAEGKLLDVVTKLIDWGPTELRSVRISLPERRHAGHSFEGPALSTLLARARVVIGRDSR